MESSLVQDHASNAGMEAMQKAHIRSMEIIPTLNKSKGWHSDMYEYQGFWYDSMLLQGLILAQDLFRAQSSDIFLCSHPKTGTTWLKALTFAIATRTQFDESSSPLLTKMPHDCIPSLELDLLKLLNQRDPETHFLATHFPYSSLPKSIIASGCKIVYVCRDPRDTFVSIWKFAEKILFKHTEPIPVEEAFEMFCQGVSHYGPYWEHVLGFWRASLESPEKILFLKYEELKKDPALYVKKLADFYGRPFSVEEEEKGVIENIVKMCSFENLSNLEVNKTGKHMLDTPFPIENNLFFRKGKVGDWKDCLTDEMAERLSQIVEQKLSGSGLTLTKTQ
ncbi:Sulfotransfer_1 domain-containing protein [Cephalotus follicularis]|uniref:Sulfotransferase n=1 Tax=Cephalotus follicularis TaxID=3775 RepID=A0A1Q3CZN2_CEPFO|nr:Sulfotransfer_1 domain-containing protein [Cephalotus follicularis]